MNWDFGIVQVLETRDKRQQSVTQKAMRPTLLVKVFVEFGLENTSQF